MGILDSESVAEKKLDSHHQRPLRLQCSHLMDRTGHQQLWDGQHVPGISDLVPVGISIVSKETWCLGAGQVDAV